MNTCKRVDRRVNTELKIVGNELGSRKYAGFISIRATDKSAEWEVCLVNGNSSDEIRLVLGFPDAYPTVPPSVHLTHPSIMGAEVELSECDLQECNWVKGPPGALMHVSVW